MKTSNSIGTNNIYAKMANIVSQTFAEYLPKINTLPNITLPNLT